MTRLGIEPRSPKPLANTKSSLVYGFWATAWIVTVGFCTDFKIFFLLSLSAKFLLLPPQNKKKKKKDNPWPTLHPQTNKIETGIYEHMYVHASSPLTLIQEEATFRKKH